MSRNLTTCAQTLAEATVVRPVILVHLALDSGAVYVNSSDRNILYGGNTYLGIGRLGAVSAIQETGILQPTGIRLGLSGIPSAYVSMVLSEPYQGRTVRLYQGFLTDTYALAVDPILQFEGPIDQMSLSLADTASISLTAESKLVRWEVPSIRRYTNADQRQVYVADEGLEFVAQTVEKQILWGRAG